MCRQRETNPGRSGLTRHGAYLLGKRRIALSRACCCCFCFDLPPIIIEHLAWQRAVPCGVLGGAIPSILCCNVARARRGTVIFRVWGGRGRHKCKAADRGLGIRPSSGHLGWRGIGDLAARRFSMAEGHCRQALPASARPHVAVHRDSGLPDEKVRGGESPGLQQRCRGPFSEPPIVKEGRAQEGGFGRGENFASLGGGAVPRQPSPGGTNRLDTHRSSGYSHSASCLVRHFLPGGCRP